MFAPSTEGPEDGADLSGPAPAGWFQPNEAAIASARAKEAARQAADGGLRVERSWASGQPAGRRPGSSVTCATASWRGCA
eukprot:8470230-Alexandrium_andersonii.AAC.1